MENNSNSGVIYQGKIPNRVKYCFAFGALGKDLIYGMIATFSMIYFTDIIKVAPAFIGSMFFVAKLWDAFNDLFMGMIVDNTRSRWGKFVPWLVIGTLINAFVFITVFTDFHLSGVSLCVFASVVYVLWGMTYTIMDIPYWSIIPNLTSDPEEREKYLFYQEFLPASVSLLSSPASVFRLSKDLAATILVTTDSH